MTVYVNERPVDVADGASLDAVLKAAGRAPELTLVTVDGRFVPPAEYRLCRPPEGAKIAVRELLGGG